MRVRARLNGRRARRLRSILANPPDVRSGRRHDAASGPGSCGSGPRALPAAQAAAGVKHMRILWVASHYEYGNPSLGLSFEEMNFRSALDAMGHDVTPFDFFAHERELGRERMNERLLEEAASERFDLIFFFLHEDQVALKTIERIGASGPPTLNWFADDHWR